MTVVAPCDLEPPRGFRGPDPDRPLVRRRRRLPHWRQAGATYFVTFRLADALPQEKRRMLLWYRRNWLRRHARMRRERVWEALASMLAYAEDNILDDGYGACYFRTRRWCDELRHMLHRFQGKRYRISCWAIMPNHCHLIMRPFDGYDLEDLVGAVKGAMARKLNVALGTSGALWQQEFYDRMIRDGAHLWRAIQYIGRNPIKAGLAREVAWRRWIHPEWEAAGWGFRDI